ncbi:MAG TPA: hypothetical protein DC054_14025 [Blastocatellia bacterium]|nr:hypothetical protein [Blastocatellia bacterium]
MNPPPTFRPPPPMLAPPPRGAPPKLPRPAPPPRAPPPPPRRCADAGMEIMSDKAVRKSKPIKLFFAIHISRKYLSIVFSFTSSPYSALSGPEIHRRSTNLTFLVQTRGQYSSGVRSPRFMTINDFSSSRRPL